MEESRIESQGAGRRGMKPVDRILFVLAVLGVLASLAYTATIYSDLPDRIPTHFGLSGDADAWGGKSSIWVVPAIMMALIALLYPVAVFNTKATDVGGEPVPEPVRFQIVSHMRRMLALIAICLSLLSWDAVFTVSQAHALQWPTAVITIILLVICVVYTVKMLSAGSAAKKSTKNPPGGS